MDYKTPEYSIVIPTFNHLEDCLKPCLESVLRNSDMSKTEIVIIANGCTDGTEEYVWGIDLPCIRLISFPESLGYTRATNIGIHNSRGKYVVLLNNDTVIANHDRGGWLELLKAPFSTNPKMGITGVTKTYDQKSKYHFIIFFCAMIEKDTFNRFGLLDEDFNPGGGEDTEYAIRLQHAGYETEEVLKNKCEYWKYETNFPIFHQAEATMHGSGLPFDWGEVFKSNGEKLAQRFLKPTKYSIVIPAIDATSLQKCIHSVWDHTEYSNCEIIIVYDHNDSDVVNYIHKIRDFGPYVFISTHGLTSSYYAMQLGASSANGEYIILLAGNAVLLDQERDQWIKQLISAFAIENVGMSSVRVGDPSNMPIYCVMLHRDCAKNIIISKHLARNVESLNKMYVDLSKTSEYFPLYVPY